MAGSCQIHRSSAIHNRLSGVSSTPHAHAVALISKCGAPHSNGEPNHMLHQRIRMPATRTQCGFTMIELFIAVAVAAVLLTVATPSFTRLMAKTGATQTSNDLVGDLATARTQAASRQQTVCLAPIAGDWLKGWDVQADSDGDGTCDELIRQHGPLDSEFKITMASGGTAVSTIDYGPDGSISGATADTDIKLCKDAGSHPQRMLVKVRASGIATVYRDTSSSGPNC